jgi:hypothetical protein
MPIAFSHAEDRVSFQQDFRPAYRSLFSSAASCCSSSGDRSWNTPSMSAVRAYERKRIFATLFRFHSAAISMYFILRHEVPVRFLSR